MAATVPPADTLTRDPERPGLLMFQCFCGRVQSHASYESGAGGITIQEALTVGWTFQHGQWRCPVSHD